jgi:hypothetical protein
MGKPTADRLRRAIEVFEGLLARCAEAREERVAEGAFVLVADQVAQADRELPGLLPPFDRDYFRGRWRPEFKLYDAGRLRHWLQVALTHLRSAEQSQVGGAAAPLDTAIDFSFAGNPALQGILERDRVEIERGLQQQCWKSVIILAGGMVEALLADVVGKVKRSRADPGAPIPDVSRWSLNDLINEAHKLELVGRHLKGLSHTLREYRNLVHAGCELRDDKLRVAAEEAQLAVTILQMVARDLAAAPR